MSNRTASATRDAQLAAVLRALFSCGWPRVRARNTAIARRSCSVFCSALSTEATRTTRRWKMPLFAPLRRSGSGTRKADGIHGFEAAMAAARCHHAGDRGMMNYLASMPRRWSQLAQRISGGHAHHTPLQRNLYDASRYDAAPSELGDRDAVAVKAVRKRSWAEASCMLAAPVMPRCCGPACAPLTAMNARRPAPKLNQKPKAVDGISPPHRFPFLIFQFPIIIPVQNNRTLWRPSCGPLMTEFAVGYSPNAFTNCSTFELDQNLLPLLSSSRDFTSKCISRGHKFITRLRNATC